MFNVRFPPAKAHGQQCTKSATTMDYYNAGDWVESCTALVEDFDGTIQLIRHVDFHRGSKVSSSSASDDHILAS